MPALRLGGQHTTQPPCGAGARYDGIALRRMDGVYMQVRWIRRPEFIIGVLLGAILVSLAVRWVH